MTLETVLRTWHYDAGIYKPEIARSTFLKSILLQKLGNSAEATRARQLAWRLREEILSPPCNTEKDMADLQMEDFDALVTFW